MSARWLCIVETPAGTLFSIENEDGSIATWPTEAQGRAALDDHPLLRAYGGEFMEWPG